jgi:hypothetical protein
LGQACPSGGKRSKIDSNEIEFGAVVFVGIASVEMARRLGDGTDDRYCRDENNFERGDLGQEILIKTFEPKYFRQRQRKSAGVHCLIPAQIKNSAAISQVEIA